MIPYRLIRSDRKTLSLSIDANGHVTVRAPKSFSQVRIEKFVFEKQAWIEKHLTRIRSKTPLTKLTEETVDGFSFPLLGEKNTLRLYDGNKTVYDAENKTVFLPKDHPLDCFVRFLKKNAKRFFSALTEKIATERGFCFYSVKITGARTRWGSCSGKNAISYSFRSLFLPKDVAEYLVVHELCHTVHKNHSKAFWAEVETILPKWRKKRAFLKDNAYLMQIL